jgi:hypothetical protein
MLFLDLLAERKIAEAVSRGELDDVAVWDARCSSGAEYRILIPHEGEEKPRVIPCVLALISDFPLDCFSRFETEQRKRGLIP